MKLTGKYRGKRGRRAGTALLLAAALTLGAIAAVPGEDLQEAETQYLAAAQEEESPGTGAEESGSSGANEAAEDTGAPDSESAGETAAEGEGQGQGGEGAGDTAQETSADAAGQPAEDAAGSGDTMQEEDPGEAVSFEEEVPNVKEDADTEQAGAGRADTDSDEKEASLSAEDGETPELSAADSDDDEAAGNEPAEETGKENDDRSGEESEEDTETESESDTEKETEKDPEKYRVYIAEGEGWTARLEEEGKLFSPGEEVRFRAEALEPEDTLMLSLHPFPEEEAPGIESGENMPIPVLSKETDAESLGTYVIEEDEESDGQSTQTYTLAEEEEPKELICSFEMPDYDILIDGEILGGEIEVKSEKAGADEDDLIDEEDYFYEAGKITVQSMMNQYWFAPSSWAQGGSDGYGSYVRSTLKKAYWIDENGNKVWKYAYCIQPLAFFPGSGTYDTSDSQQLSPLDPEGSLQNRRLAKALYYLYGGPAWGDNVEQNDGTKINLKKILESYGCSGQQEYYVAAHLILSYIYAKGDWSQVDGCTLDNGSIVRGVLTNKAKEAVEEIVAKIDEMDEAVTELSAYNLSASFTQDHTAMRSQAVKYRAAYANTAVVHLPKGITLVNTTQGTSGTGNVSVNGGDRFYLEASPGSVEGIQKYDITTTYPVNFTAYKLLKDGKQQDISFGYMTGAKELGFTVDWPEAQGRIGVKKKDASTKDGKPCAAGYSFAGAAYGLYSDSGCTKLLETISVGADGSGVSAGFYAPGTYYLKETAAPSCGLYKKSGEVISVKLSDQDAAGGAVVSADAAEEPALVPVGFYKQDSDSADGSPLTSVYSFAGAAYGLYSDSGCTKLLETITAGADGKGISSGAYPAGTYYLKETKAPSCGLYEMSTAVITLKVSEADAKAGKSVTAAAKEKPLRLLIRVNKLDADTGKPQPAASSLSFAGAVYGVYSDSGCTKLVCRITTDESGSAATEKILAADNWYVKELEAPEGYLPDPEVHKVAAADAAAAITKNGGTLEITSNERVIRGNVALAKILGASGGARLAKPDDISGIVYRFTYASDPSVSFSVLDHEVNAGDGKSRENCIETDSFGYATTESSAYPYGTLIYGTWTIEEFNAPEGYEAISASTVEITKDGQLLRYVVSDEQIAAWLAVEKRDALTGSAIPAAGVAFEIMQADGSPVRMFDASVGGYAQAWKTGGDGRFILPQPLPAGSYVLRELDGIPEGYGMPEPLSFSITQAAQDPEEPLVITCEEPPLTGGLKVTKKDALTGETAGEGFVFEVRAAEDITDMAGTVRKAADAEGSEVPLVKGTLVGTMETGPDGTASMEGLFPGLYEVRETSAADGYAVTAAPQETGIRAVYGEEMTAELIFEDHPTTLILRKRDGTRQIPVEGAVFSLRPEDGGDEEILLTTDADGQTSVSGLSRERTYIVKEVQAAPGYVPDETEHRFTVDGDGKIEGSWKYTLEISNVPNEVSVSKTDITGGPELPGAKLEIRDAEGNLVAQWVSETEPKRLTGLPSGTYTLTEITAPYGYELAETIEFTLEDSLVVQQVEMKDAPWREVTISKKTVTGDDELPGAKLEIRDSDGELKEAWTSGEEPHEVRLPAGTYTLTEITAPAGFLTAETIEFTVEKVTETDCSVSRVEMRDAPIEVEISKKDAESGKLLPGAELALKSEAGKEICRWTSTGEPKKISPLPAGSYTIAELSAPAGYEKAQDLKISVEEKSGVQSFEMIDKRTPPAQAVPGTPGAPRTLDAAGRAMLILEIMLVLSAAAALISGRILVLRKRRR